MRKDRSKALSVKGRMVVTAALAAVIFASCPLAASAAPSAPSASVGAKIRRVVPSTIRNIADHQADQSVDLGLVAGQDRPARAFLDLVLGYLSDDNCEHPRCGAVASVRQGFV